MPLDGFQQTGPKREFSIVAAQATAAKHGTETIKATGYLGTVCLQGLSTDSTDVKVLNTGWV